MPTTPHVVCPFHYRFPELHKAFGWTPAQVTLGLPCAVCADGILSEVIELATADYDEMRAEELAAERVNA